MIAVAIDSAVVRTLHAQDGVGQARPAYLNTSLPAEQRAADLVGRMTLQETASQLVNQARAIRRLNVPAYDWWSGALHGVTVDGTTEFPEPIGLPATFERTFRSKYTTLNLLRMRQESAENITTKI